MDFEGFPLMIGWELTLKCNLRCRHCGSSAGMPRENELSTKEALKICDQFPDLLVQEVDFTGGEPLLRKDWAEISLYLKDLGIKTNILTHGLDLDIEKIYEIRESGVSCLGISLDGVGSTHDYIRGHPGAFNKVLKNIEKVLHEGMNLNIITTANSLNVDELPKLYQILQNLGLKYWRIQPLIPIGRVKSSKDLHIEKNAVLDIGTFIRQFKPKAEKKGMQIISSDGLQYIFEEEKTLNERPWRGCPAGMVTCGITSNGMVKGCLSMQDDLIEGDLRKNDLWDIWFKPGSFPYTRNFKVDKLGPNCSQCDMGEQCKGGCSISSYSATGIFHNDPYCFYMINKSENNTSETN